MAAIERYRVVWTGGPGGEGVSTFYAQSGALTALADLRAFFLSLQGLFPSVISFSFPNSGDIIEDSTGALIGSWTSSSVTAVQGQGANATFASGVGARVRWGTNEIINGRRLRGATFLTSLVTSAYQSDGTIAAATLTAIQNAADTLVAVGDFVVWARPAPGAADGESGLINSATVPDRVTALRSRRY